MVKLEAAQSALRLAFLAWQCRLRQMSVRHGGGRPTSGMRPELFFGETEAAQGEITVLIVKKEPDETTSEFRHMVRRTHDPNERYKAAQKFLAAAYYQGAADFSDEVTALFGAESRVAAALLQAGRCRLRFEQYSQVFDLPCAVRRLMHSDPAYQATYWHNSLYTPSLPAEVTVLGFQPDWARAEAIPPIP